MIACGKQDLRQGLALAFALALMAGAPIAHGQKMYKCSDGAGGTTFQQAPCGESAKDAEARSKDRERLEAEAVRKKDDEARKKAESIQKAKDRDKAYLEQAQQRADEIKKAEEAEKRLLQGTTLEGARPTAATPVPSTPGAPEAKGSASDEGLPAHVAAQYPGPWRDGPQTRISSVFEKKAVTNCSGFRYRQSARSASEFIVNCKGGSGKNHYFVWPETDGVRGPVTF